MEKNDNALNEEISYLKKSQKNKRKAQMWEHTIQFYRNHQASLTNYHILKLIKIAMKPLRKTILASCRYLSKYSLRSGMRVDDPKFNDESNQQIEYLKAKIAVLQNLMDSYTLVLQAFLNQTNPTYFNMLFRQSYHSTRNPKQLLFEPANIRLEQLKHKLKAEHQLSSYFRFVCESTILFCTSSMIYNDEKIAFSHLKKSQQALSNIFNSSHKFASKKLEFQILKLNLISKMQKPIDLQVIYQFPYEMFNLMYKNRDKWSQSKIRYYYNLLFKYLFLTINKIHKIKFSDKITNIETEIYAFMREIILINQFIFINTRTQFYRRFLEYIVTAIASYEMRLQETKRWVSFLSNYFDYKQLSKMTGTAYNKNFQETILKEILNVSTAATKSQFQIKQKIITKKLRKTDSVNKNSEITISSLNFNNEIKKIFHRIGNVYEIIEESDSDDEGFMINQFQKNRRQQIHQFEKENTKNKQKPNELGNKGIELPCIGKNRDLIMIEQTKNKINYMDIQEANRKLSYLGKQTERFRSFSAAALQALTKVRDKNKAEDKLGTSNKLKINKLEMDPILNYNRKNQFSTFETSLKKIINDRKPDLFLPIIPKQSQYQTQQGKSIQHIMLSDKYDKMSRMLLLTNTNKKDVNQ